MLHYVTDHTGRRWRVETSGGSYEADRQERIGVWFIDDSSEVRFLGRLSPAEVQQPTDGRLLDVLAQTLRDKLEEDDKPIVMKLQADPEMFHINDERFIQLVHDPAMAGRAGYSMSEKLITMDEVALREALTNLEFDEEQMNAAIALARLTYTGA
jgi:hypothetical protein